MHNTETIDAFLCHNKIDKEWVRILAERIEAETLDEEGKQRKLKVFFDEWDIDVGENAINRMNDGLNKTRYLVVVMSPEFFNSGWTNFEWTHVVSLDPAGVQKRIIPILLRNTSEDGSRLSLPAPFRVLNHIDFRDKRKFETKFQRLLRRIRGLPPQRGRTIAPRYSGGTPAVVVDTEPAAWEPDPIRDLLLGNLFQVFSIPTKIACAKTECRKLPEVWKTAPGAEPCILRKESIYTFADLRRDACVLQGVIEPDSIKDEFVRDWLLDTDKQLWLIELLNRSLSSHLSKLAIKRDKKGRFFFRPDKDGGTRVWGGREVAAKKIVPATGKEFWVHHAARIRFVRLGERFFLLVEPTFMFTVDGDNPVGSKEMGRMVLMWGGKQQNAEILRSVMFWAKTIAKNKKEMDIATGGESIIISAVPGLAMANTGIDGDHIRIGALLKAPDSDLDDVARDVEVAEASGEDDTQEGEANAS